MKVFSLRLLAFVFVIILCSGAALQVFAASETPAVSARSAVLAEGESGRVVWSKNGSERLPMASTTKIMTAIAALEAYPDTGKTVTVADAACGVEGSSVYLKAGEKLTMDELLSALLIESANDAAVAIAVEVSGSVEKFAELMNETAARIGMNDSHFTNPHGLDSDEHYTTAEDMAKLAVYAMKNADFARIVSTYKTTIPMNGDEGTRLLLNHNKLLKYYDGAVGIKTGFTKKSGRCLVSAAERNGVRMIAVTLSAPDDWNDHRAMLDYGFASYKRVDIAAEGGVSYSLPVTGGTANSVTISNRDGCSLSLPVSSGEPVCTIEAPRFVIAPVTEGDILGHAVYRIDGKEVARLPLYAKSGCVAAKNKSLWEKILELY